MRPGYVPSGYFTSTSGKLRNFRALEFWAMVQYCLSFGKYTVRYDHIVHIVSETVFEDKCQNNTYSI
jgi:hypothetical protein